MSGLRSSAPLWLAVALIAPVGSAHAAALADADQQQLLGNVAAYETSLSKTALDIWGYSEVGFQEVKSSKRLQDELRKAGFNIEIGVAGMPTSFVARFTNGTGPVIGVLAEFDALPGLSQTAEPQRQRAPDRSAGHACGHHLFGAASVSAAIAVKRWMAANKVPGELRVYGTPAEEGGSGKVFMVRAGIMNDVSAMLHWHPSDKNSAAQDHSLANVSGKFRFRGASAHAAAAPERGISALDGVEAMNFMVNALREHVPQDARIHYVITKGGEAPNVVPDFAEVYYYVRHPDQKVVVQVMDRVKKASEGAALGTGTRVEFEQIGGTFNTLPNDTLGRVVYENLKRVGGVEYTGEERAWAEKLTATLPASGQRHPSNTIVEYEVDKIQYGSTDVGDVSYTVPTVGFRTATWVPGTPAHSWQAVASGGTSIGVKGAMVAAKVLALSAAELMKSPETITAATAELKDRRGADFVYRSLLGDKPPALDYRKPAQDSAAASE